MLRKLVFLLCIIGSGSLVKSIQFQAVNASTSNIARHRDDLKEPEFITSHLVPRGDKRKASSETSNTSGPSKSRKIGPGGASRQIQSERPPSPGPASSDSMSKSSRWRGSGFTQSDSPSSWGSWHSNPEHPLTNLKVWTKGSAIVRTRTMNSKRRDFSEVDSKLTNFKKLQDPQKSQAAVHVLSHKGNAGVSGYGKYSTVRVDARKSKHGGWISRVGPSGKIDDIVHVPPGTKTKYAVQYTGHEQKHGARGFVQGKGTIKVDSSNVWPSYVDQPRLIIDSPRTSKATGSDYSVASGTDPVPELP